MSVLQFSPPFRKVVARPRRLYQCRCHGFALQEVRRGILERQREGRNSCATGPPASSTFAAQMTPRTSQQPTLTSEQPKTHKKEPGDFSNGRLAAQHCLASSCSDGQTHLRRNAVHHSRQAPLRQHWARVSNPLRPF